MIHYSLRCAVGHEFDGWFRSIAAFDQQAVDGHLACPVCGSSKVGRAPMAPNLARRRDAAIGPSSAENQDIAGTGVTAPAPPSPAAPPAEIGAMPDPAPDAAAVRAALLHLRQMVESRCDHVGAAFPEEARRIHYGEAPIRGIYGEATPREVDELREEGIAIGKIPWVRSDA